MLKYLGKFRILLSGIYWQSYGRFLVCQNCRQRKNVAKLRDKLFVCIKKPVALRFAQFKGCSVAQDIRSIQCIKKTKNIKLIILDIMQFIQTCSTHLTNPIGICQLYHLVINVMQKFPR
jgi:hypothetical protein